MKIKLLTLWRRTAGRITARPGPSAAELNFLRLVEREGGALVDGDERLDGWWGELRSAARRGRVTCGSGWDTTIRLTEAGRQALRAAPWVVGAASQGRVSTPGWAAAMTVAKSERLPPKLR